VKLGAAIRILPLVGLLLIGFGVNAQSTQSRQQSERYVVDYYYTAKWGFADEFIRLFRKNHFPVLKKQIETGRIVEVTASRPRYHATEDGRWDYRVTITWKNVAASIDNSGEDAIIKQLYPDQETFRREEQRRFEILLAHWDVPVVSVPLDQ
jgi:hypothetical protein